MKTKLATFILIAAFGLAVISFADEPRSAENQTQTIKIKRLDGTIVDLTHEIQTHTVKIRARGETVAEFKVSTNNPVVFEGAFMIDANGRAKARLVGAKGGAITVRINCSGEFPIIFKADEVEFEKKGLVASPLLVE
jgi:hypothetical protein